MEKSDTLINFRYHNLFYKNGHWTRRLTSLINFISRSNFELSSPSYYSKNIKPDSNQLD
jgi:hypothetical protein